MYNSTILVADLRIFSRIWISFCICGDYACTQYSRCGLYMRFVYDKKVLLVYILLNFLFIILKINKSNLAFAAAFTHCVL